MSDRRPIGVLIVDDHAVVRAGFRLVLDACEGIRVAGEAESGEAALARCRELGDAVDVILLDLSMPGLDGLETARQLRARHSRLSILALSAHDEPSYVRRLLRLGVQGYLSKRSAPEQLIEAVRGVANGEGFLDPRLAHRLAADGDPSGSGVEALLSEREFEVFLRLARGQTVGEIARGLHLSESTVGSHLYHVKQKLGLRNQSEITLLAMREKLLDLG